MPHANTSAKLWYSRFRGKGAFGDALYNAFDRILEAIREVHREVEAISGGGAGSAAAPVTYLTLLGADYSVPDPVAVANGSLILYVLRQDATGGWTVTWPASFNGMPDPDTVDKTPGTQMTALMYKESAIRVYPAALVVSGVPVT